MVTLAVLLAGAKTVVARIESWRATTSPHAVVADALVTSALNIEYGLAWLGAEPDEPDELDARRATAADHVDSVAADVAARLVRAACVLRRDLPRRLETGSEVVDARVRDDAAAMAGALYEWVFALRMEGRPGLPATQAKIVSALPPAAAGEWQRFPRAQSPSITARSRVRSAASALKSIAIALVPLALVLAVSSSRIELPDGAIGSLYTFALTFFAVSVLGALDPRSAENPGTTKDMLETFKGTLVSRGGDR